MTEKQGYENVLMELRKAKAASLHLEDYNYWWNKGVQEYSNERYSLFEATQQLTDDLQALIVSTTLVLNYQNNTAQYAGSYSQSALPITFGKRYGSDFVRFASPTNYWHMTGSHVTSASLRPYKCHPAGYIVNNPSKRLTSNIANGVLNNTYLKPSNERPYHSFLDGSNGNTKPDLLYFVGDTSKFLVTEIAVDYLKEPRRINLTVSQRDLPLDTSATIEFPEYVCAEIVKRVVKLILEVSSDPRIATNPQVNNSIQ
jgi:hypothetical protein